MTCADTAIAAMKAATEKLARDMRPPLSAREVDRALAMSASAGELSAEQREALAILKRLGIAVPENGQVSAAAVDRAIAKFDVSQRLRRRCLKNDMTRMLFGCLSNLTK
jgi:hypothetical protein